MERIVTIEEVKAAIETLRLFTNQNREKDLPEIGDGFFLSYDADVLSNEQNGGWAYVCFHNNYLLAETIAEVLRMVPEDVAHSIFYNAVINKEPRRFKRNRHLEVIK